MTPGELLPVEPGDRVLDLCAAPGGKSTQLGARLLGEGLLVSNDISNSRARALLKNLELAGIPNLCAPAAGDFSRRRDHAAARGNHSVLHLHLLAGGG